MTLNDAQVAAIRVHHAKGAHIINLARVYGTSEDEIRCAIGEAAPSYLSKLRREMRDAGVCAKLTRANILDIRARLACGERGSRIAQSYGVTRATISRVKRGATWKDVQSG